MTAPHLTLYKAWDIFDDNIRAALDLICPIRKLTIPEDKPKWLTADIINLMRDRDALCKRARRTGNQDDWNIARLLRNRVQYAIRTYKAEQIKSDLNRFKNNPQKFWSKIRDILPTEKPDSINTLVDIDNDNEIINRAQLPNHINSYFSGIGEKLAIPLLQQNPISETVVNHQNYEGIENLNNIITEQELLPFLEKINTKKSSAISGVRTIVYKDAFLLYPNKICKIYNASLEKGVFPMKWKSGIVIPLPKIPNVKEAADLRPISLLPLPGKVLERLVCRRLHDFQNINNTLTQVQHGFRKGRSTMTAISALLNEIYDNINKSLTTYVFFLDFKKAFDTVSHKILLNKLDEIGIPPKLSTWFSSYLCNRYQKVNLDGNISDSRLVSYGVPQGSVVGPTLFSIYINNLPNTIGLEGMQKYADDTVLYGSDCTALQGKLNKAFEWCGKNILTLNSKKTQWMRVGPQQQKMKNQSISFTIGNTQLVEVDSYKYLGLTLDSKLDYQIHRSNLTSKIHQKLNYFAKIRKYITVDSALIIYKATILPLLDYADYIYEQQIK